MLNPKKILAMIIILIVGFSILHPAMGFTVKSGGHRSYSATSGSRINFSLVSGVPAHKLTQEMVANKYSIQTPAVQSTKVPYSFKEGQTPPYSIKILGVTKAVSVGYQTTKAAARLGSVAKTIETTGVPAPAVAAAAAANVTAAPVVVAPKFAIEGIAFDDVEGNGVIEGNDLCLAELTINLEQPAGTVIMSVNTTMDGKFAFSDLSAGEYVVSEVLKEGWKLIAPADGKFVVTITNESITNLAFSNQPLNVPITDYHLTLNSKPINAAISIDRKMTLHKTPDKVPFRKPGNHSYELTLTGYKTYENRTYVEFTTLPRINLIRES